MPLRLRDHAQGELQTICRRLLRSAKDLGRVLALAELAGRGEVERWPATWLSAMHCHYGSEEVADLGAHVGDGLRELLTRGDALDDALHAVDVGLLSGFGVTKDGLVAIAERLVVDAIDPFVELTRGGS